METKFFNPKTVKPETVPDKKIQPKLEVNPPNDEYEQEADQVADRVSRMPSSASDNLQMLPKEDEDKKLQMKSEDEENELQMKPEEEESIRMKPEEEEKGEIQMNSNNAGGQKVPQVSSELTSQLNSTKGKGSPLSDDVSKDMGQKMGTDFSNVRVHTDDNAVQMSQELGAKAFTYGNDIYFNSSKYNPDNASGKHLLAHELTHVVQQRQNIVSPLIQRWAASVHQNLTTGIIKQAFASDFSENARIQLSFYSGQLDQRICNYLYYLQDFILPNLPIIGPMHDWKLKVTTFGQKPKINEIKPLNIQSYALSEYEASNHGEANRYLKSNYNEQTGEGTKTSMNQVRMEEHLNSAIEKANKDGITREVLIDLGLALHVGQDRGSHEEGIYGHGHGRKTDAFGNKWETDNPAMNSMGYMVAKVHTLALISSFVNRLSPALKKQLSSLNLSSLAGTPTGIPNLDGKSESGQGGKSSNSNPSNPITYLCIYKGMPTTSEGLPKRLFGMLPYLYQLDIGKMEGKETTFFVNPQVGLRLMQLSPYVNVDLMTGVAVGTGLDNSAVLGISAGVQFGLTKGKTDINIMLNHIHNVSGLPPLTVIGINGVF